MKRLTLFLTLALGILFSAYAQNQLRVEFLSGSDYYRAISTIGRMTVSDDVLRIYAHSGQLLVERSLSDIDKITFGDNGSVTAIPEEAEASLHVYPNPTHEMLFVDGVNAGMTVRLFSLDGRLLETVASDGQQMQIQVGTLPHGIYLLQINTDIIRFIKD